MPVRVGVLIKFGVGDENTRHGGVQWPSSIGEKEALVSILQSLSPPELGQLAEVHLSQNVRKGEARIEWLDAPPHGVYAFQQHLFGKEGVVTLQKEAEKEKKLTYSPDITNDVDRPLPDEHGERVGPRAQPDALLPPDAPLDDRPSVSFR